MITATAESTYADCGLVRMAVAPRRSNVGLRSTRRYMSAIAVGPYEGDQWCPLLSHATAADAMHPGFLACESALGFGSSPG